MDIAATELYKKNYYYYRGGTFSRKEQIRFVNKLVRKYNLFYVIKVHYFVPLPQGNH